MVAICANPTCCQSFTNLSQGKLYLLPPMETWLRLGGLSQWCYWLCPECSQEYIMTRYQGEVVLVSQIGSDYETQPSQLLGPRRVG